MTTVARSFIGIFWLLRLVCAVFPEESGPLNFIPTEGNVVSISHAVIKGQGWARLHSQALSFHFLCRAGM